MIRLYTTICYIYDNYVYQGIMSNLSGKGLAKEQAIGIFSFIQFWNINTVINLFNITWFLELSIWIQLTFAMVLFIINYKYLIDKKTKKKPSVLMIIGTISYGIGSLGLYCLSMDSVALRATISDIFLP